MVARKCSRCEGLMCTNVGDARLRNSGNLLLIGSCMATRYPDIVEEFSKKNGDQPVLEVCLEETHVDQAGFKIASVVRYASIRGLTVLTIDGSPHCVQLHMVVEDIKRHFTPEVETAHYVVEKDNVYEISAEAVKRARHLSRIQASLNGVS